MLRLAIWLRKNWAAVVLSAAVVIAAAAIIAAFAWPLTDLIAAHDVGTITGTKRPAALQSARDAARGRLLQFGAGLFAAAALVFTARNFTLSREGQVTDRYTKAIEQLGSDKLDVRIGGIYALERVARDSAKDHPTVMEVLAAFIREHSPQRKQEPLPTTNTDVPRASMRKRILILPILAASIRKRILILPILPSPDALAAITVIGRRNGTHDRGQIDLSNANLNSGRLDGTSLKGADLNSASLTGAILAGANLKGARLNDTDLRMAVFEDANLSGASAVGANLNGANLTGANLTGANLFGANLDGADLFGADLTGANLAVANLTGANLTRAKWPLSVTVPDGWVRDPDSGRLERASKQPPDGDGGT
jgi:Pentapeptide repeats (8 copies)